MATHEYTPEEALERLLSKVTAQDSDLAAQIRVAIDAGKDVWETEPTTNRRKKPHVYRMTIPLSLEDALQVALDVLQAYFVEQPLFLSSQAANFSRAVIGQPVQQGFAWRTGTEEPASLPFEAEDTEKAVEIELQTETQISRAEEPPLPLKRIPKEQIDEQLSNIKRLRVLADFAEE